MAWVMPTTVGEEDQSVIDQTVAGGARGPLHDVELGLLVGEGDGGHHVGEQVHSEDGQRGEGQGDLEHNPGLWRSCVTRLKDQNSHSPRRGGSRGCCWSACRQWTSSGCPAIKHISPSFSSDVTPLTKISLPSSTPLTMVAKSSSMMIMSAASLDTSVPAMPMATLCNVDIWCEEAKRPKTHPMSAFFKAGELFTLSPVTATT